MLSLLLILYLRSGLQVKKELLIEEIIMCKAADLSKLYTVRLDKSEGDQSIFAVDIDPQHSVFEGHFPAMPVMPGVCMMAMIRSCISLATGKGLRYKSIRRCKFLSVVDPTKQASVFIHLTQTSPLSFSAAIHAGEQPVLKIQAEMQIE